MSTQSGKRAAMELCVLWARDQHQLVKNNNLLYILLLLLKKKKAFLMFKVLKKNYLFVVFCLFFYLVYNSCFDVYISFI